MWAIVVARHFGQANQLLMSPHPLQADDRGDGAVPEGATRHPHLGDRLSVEEAVGGAENPQHSS